MDKIGKYEIRGVLGTGATSTVYLADDHFAERQVAIKVVNRRDSNNPVARFAPKLFITEASLVGKLTHPHIVQIYDAVHEDELSYIVMEYVAGGTLEACCQPDTLLPVGEVLEVVFKCSRALDFAFRMGIIHRDLKPANILRGSAGDVKISDFGAAINPASGQTQINGIGSPAYMSPEQLKDHPLTHRSDVFSLGVVMYQLLTGFLPFPGTTNASVIYQILNWQPVMPSTLRADVPARVDAIVERCLSKDPAQRYDSWQDLSFELAETFRREYLINNSDAIGDTEKFESLRALPFFQGFGDVQLWEVVHLSNWRRVHAGEVLMREGDPGDGFCVLAEGEVKVTRNGRLLNVLRAGECFGEMAYLNDPAGVRGADVTCLGEATIIVIGTDTLKSASEACRASFDRAFLRVLVERLALANVRLTAL